MCSVFSDLSPDAYAYQTRSVRLGGHATSIRLEAAFWRILEEIGLSQGVSLGKFLTKLHDEVVEVSGAQNFTSMLRCACLTYLSEVRGQTEAQLRLRREAASAFNERQPEAAL